LGFFVLRRGTSRELEKNTEFKEFLQKIEPGEEQKFSIKIAPGEYFGPGNYEVRISVHEKKERKRLEVINDSYYFRIMSVEETMALITIFLLTGLLIATILKG
jgi:uncharacterized membrane protein